MLRTFTRLLAVSLVVLLPTTFATAMSRAVPEAVEADQAARGTAHAASFGPDRAVPPGRQEVATITASDQSRGWLRSLSTTPMRPRLPRNVSSPRSTYQFTWNARLRVDDPVPGAVHTVLGTQGVRFATTIHLADLQAETATGTLRVAFVDADRFRVFTPRITGDAEALWHGLREGQVVLTHHASRRMGVAPGDRVSIGGHDLVVAGAAALGSANVAEAVVDARAVDPSGHDYTSTVLVGLQRLRERPQVAARLQAAGVGEVREVRDVRPYRAELDGADPGTVAAFEPFTFVEGNSRGWLRVDPDWVKRNIARGEVPILGEVVCHKLMFPQLRAALAEIVDSGLEDLVDADDYGGCYAPRHIGRNPHSPLSMHAWGLAIDFNVQTNLYGHTPQLDPRVVEVFERHGFNWGGDWRTPDGMHFELGVLHQAP